MHRTAVSQSETKACPRTGLPQSAIRACEHVVAGAETSQSIVETAVGRSIMTAYLNQALTPARVGIAFAQPTGRFERMPDVTIAGFLPRQCNRKALSISRAACYNG